MKKNYLLSLLLIISSILGLSAQNLNSDKFRDNYAYPEGQEKLENIVVEGALFPSVAEPVNTTADGRKVWYMFDIEGNDYLVAEFKNASGNDAGIWMTQSLRTRTYPDGDIIPYNGLAGSTVSSYGYPGAVTGVGSMKEPFYRWDKEQGLVYTWAVATYPNNNSEIDQGWREESALTANPFTATILVNEVERVSEGGKIQGVCPAGWHLPSDRELSQLIYVIRQNPSAYGIQGKELTKVNGGVDFPVPSGTPSLVPASKIGTVLKSALALTDHNMGAPTGLSLSSWQGGVNLLLVGQAINGSANAYGFNGFLWSSSSRDNSKSYIRVVNSSSEDVGRTNGGRSNLFPVRCKKD